MYQQPQTIDDIITHSVAHALDMFGIETEGVPRWNGGQTEAD